MELLSSFVGIDIVFSSPLGSFDDIFYTFVYAPHTTINNEVTFNQDYLVILKQIQIIKNYFFISCISYRARFTHIRPLTFSRNVKLFEHPCRYAISLILG